MDGYPEGAAHLIEHLPPAALSWRPGVRELLEHHAAPRAGAAATA
jgi:hypothetical protein